MDGELPEPGITAERIVEIEREHTTNLFGKQQTPTGLPAAADIDPDEPIRVLGTPQLLAEVEFLGRESLHGTLPDGTGLVGIDATVTHRKAVPIGRTVRVETKLIAVSGRKITIEGTLYLSDSEALVGEVTNRLQVVNRETFKDGIEK
jgi:predicted thioesterase